MERYAIFKCQRLNIVKISILPKLIYKFSTFPVKIPVGFFFSPNSI